MTNLEKVRQILVGLLLLLVTGCATTTLDKNSAAVAHANSTRMLIISYINDDQIALKRIEAPLATLSYLLAEAEQLGDSRSLFEFLANPSNSWYMSQSINSYMEIKAAITDFYQRTGKPVPPEIIKYDQEVLMSYNQIVRAVNSKDRQIRVINLVNVLVKMLYARNGQLI